MLQLHGGIGIIHGNFKSVEEQMVEIEKVKRFKQGFISNPAALKATDTIKDLLDLKV
jgi:IMP dehydrogenase